MSNYQEPSAALGSTSNLRDTVVSARDWTMKMWSIKQKMHSCAKEKKKHPHSHSLTQSDTYIRSGERVRVWKLPEKDRHVEYSSACAHFAGCMNSLRATDIHGDTLVRILVQQCV